MTNFGRLLACLIEAEVEFVVVGGFAATAHGLRCRFVNLPTLIHLKRAAGRPKDIERIAELEAIQQERSMAAVDVDRLPG